MRTLAEVFDLLAPQLGLPSAMLMDFAKEDPHDGYHSNLNLCQYPKGSIWAVEGQVLYALVRALKPFHVVDIGTFYGCGAAHMLQAMECNDKGILTCLNTVECGDLIPHELLHRCQKVRGKEEDVFPSLKDAEIVFIHATDKLSMHLMRAVKNFRPKIIISHDGNSVRILEEWKTVFNENFHSFQIEPSDCSLACKVLNSYEVII